MDANLKNVALKTFWTAVAAALSFLAIELADVQAEWTILATAVLTYAMAFVREQLGHTTPDLPPAGPLGQLSTR